MHKPKPFARESATLAYWREIDSELRRIGETPPGFVEVATLFHCGYSIPQALRALAPHYRPALRLVVSH